MNKQELLVGGLTEEQADKVMELLKDFVPKSRFNEVNEMRKEAEKQLQARDAQIEELKKSDITADLKTQIEALQAENAKNLSALNATRLENAIQMQLKDAGARNVKAVMPFIDLTKYTVGENGEVNGLADAINALKTDANSNFLFVTETAKGAPSGVTPVNGRTQTTGITKAQFNRMSYKERIDLYNSDRETYNTLVNEE